MKITNKTTGWMCQAGAYVVLSSNNQILLKMKKLIKISLVIVVSTLFFLNVKLNISDDKIGRLSFTANSQVAQAWDGICEYNSAYGDCFCADGCAPCGGICPQGKNGSTCTSA